MKTKFVTVKPISNKATNKYYNMMDQLHSCRVEQEEVDRLFLTSITERYSFWMNKENDHNWQFIK